MGGWQLRCRGVDYNLTISITMIEREGKVATGEKDNVFCCVS